ncbi:molybdopterin synthase sulfur carrier subunit [Soonwooa buanensis]|uniref:Molybdopterin synthase sulfur carrier subunit n=1 Tax=Soonwooa buanensis TaxID=619805 RepID=A0A1T5CPP2_9FLAO|nr:MoaD/ThiS family protein [Soonwooa buanensis]SKB61140.1 molybdopterin synthase sulfur carrier subunit [Soonwooa buanensis]
MKLKILAFGIVKDIFGNSEIELQMPETANVKDLKNELEEKYEALKRLKSYFIAVNEEYAEDDLQLHPNNEIAIIPPVSGG